jgi:predicted chitinase
MDAQGLDDNDTRAGLAAICMGESRMFGHTETGYSHTSNDRIRKVFGARVEHASDDELDELKADDRAWFDFIYSPRNSVGKMLGNTQLDDGYNYRGRGFIQLTGRDNYRRYGEKAGHPEIVQEPDKANDPEIAAALAVAYIKDRYKGGGFERMMRCVGNNTPDIAEPSGATTSSSARAASTPTLSPPPPSPRHLLPRLSARSWPKPPHTRSTGSPDSCELPRPALLQRRRCSR